MDYLLIVKESTLGIGICEVIQGGIASRLGLKVGDRLYAVNGQPVRDSVDYRYLISEELVRLRIRRDGREFEVEVEKAPDRDLGVVVEEFEYRRCPNRCLFCFVDQLPPGLRPSLYIKDDDYRLSFLQGTYITLTGVPRSDLDRIIEQRLSPLYLSVHTTDPDLRRLMLGNRRAGEILDRITYLAQGNIELHTQIVLCPGINDGPYLRRSVEDLSRCYPQVRSVAVVPVGLTKYRDGLYPLRPVDPAQAAELVEEVSGWQRSYRRRFGETFVYLADEFYLLAGAEIPPADWYDDFPQVENGVGMARLFWDEFEAKQELLPKQIERKKRMSLVTGVLAAGFMRDIIVARLNRVEDLEAGLIVVRNEFFGEKVTVSGLLTGQDILNALKGRDLGDLVLLPPNCVNGDGVLLDDMRPEEIGAGLGVEVRVLDDDLITSLKGLLLS